MTDRVQLFLTLTLYALPGLVVGFTLHELAHALVAVRLGDETPRRDGRLTLDPLEHIDPVGFALLIGIGFGFAKPVIINTLRIRTRARAALVSASGPLTNLVLALVLGVVLRILVSVSPGISQPDGFATGLGSVSLGHGGPGFISYFVLYQALVVNALLFVFNMIPIPPLDGFGVFRGLFFGVVPEVVLWMEHNARILQVAGLVLLLALPATGQTGAVGFIGDAADGITTHIFNGSSPAYVDACGSDLCLYSIRGIYPFINVLR